MCQIFYLLKIAYIKNAPKARSVMIHFFNVCLFTLVTKPTSSKFISPACSRQVSLWLTSLGLQVRHYFRRIILFISQLLSFDFPINRDRVETTHYSCLESSSFFLTTRKSLLHQDHLLRRSVFA